MGEGELPARQGSTGAVRRNLRAGSDRQGGLGRPLDEVLGAHEHVDLAFVLSPVAAQDRLDLALRALSAGFPDDLVGYCHVPPGGAPECRISGPERSTDAAFALSWSLVAAARSSARRDESSASHPFVVGVGHGSSLGIRRRDGELTEHERQLVDAIAALVGRTAARSSSPAPAWRM